MKRHVVAALKVLISRALCLILLSVSNCCHTRKAPTRLDFRHGAFLTDIIQFKFRNFIRVLRIDLVRRVF